MLGVRVNWGGYLNPLLYRNGTKKGMIEGGGEGCAAYEK